METKMFNDMLQYLSTKPWKEVNGFIQAIHADTKQQEVKQEDLPQEE